MLGIILIVVGAVCAFSFPSFLIEAIKETDKDVANTAKKFACITFGVLTIIIGALIVLCNM